MTQHKMLIYIAIFIFLITMVCVVGLVYFDDQVVLTANFSQYTKEDLAYYRHLSRRCLKKESVSCCMTSVRRMMAHHSREVPSEGCAEGFKSNMLKCVDSYRWCEHENFK